MPRITPEQARATKRRRTLLSWLPISLVALGLAVVAVAAISASGWWWFQADRGPSQDQAAEDSSTVFTGAGIDYLGVDGTLRVKIRDDAPPASTLGLQRDDEQRFDMRVPITAIVLAQDGGFGLELVDGFEVRSHDDRISSVTLETQATGTYRNAFATLRGDAQRWGWQIADVDALEAQFVDEIAQTAGGQAVTVSLEPVRMHGAWASAAVTSAGVGGQVAYTVASTPEEASAIVTE